MKYEITKGSEKDFEGAPEWARLVVEHCEFKNNTWFFESDKAGGQWKHCKGQLQGVVSRDGIGNWLNIIAERRPITEPVWDGEGLPPVGSRIQYSCIKFDENRPAIQFGEWYVGTVIAYHDGFVWVSENGIRRLSNTMFRPISSPEDVARDEAIEAMRDVGYTLPAAIRFTKEEMAALYDAGYRKME